MTKRRDKPTPLPPAAAPAVTISRPPGAAREMDILAIGASLFCIALGYLSRQATNPDGVSYLDLAAALQRGDWSHFVQGYWSPLFPFLAGIIGSVTGLTGVELVPAAHLLNVLAAVAGIFIIWRWARQTRQPLLGRSMIAAFTLCSAGLPRVEAITPDVMLLAVTTALAYELLARDGKRWWILGGLLGIAFIVKTSTWPWLLMVLPLRLWAARDTASRRQVWLSSAVSLVVMLVWVIPMSGKAGHPTLGSSGRLNYSWYIAANSSRSPDTDRGLNSSYRGTPVGQGQQIVLASLDSAAYWTYQPWGDPTAWEATVQRQTGRPPSAVEMVSYWWRTGLRVFGLWLLPVFMTIMLPLFALQYRRGMWQTLRTTRRIDLAVMIMGLLGVLQFVAIHAEPRLIAPFGLMLAAGWIHWCCDVEGEVGLRRSPQIGLVLGWLGVVGALVFAVPKIGQGITDTRRLEQVTEQLDHLKEQILASGETGTIRLGVVGPVMPVVGAAFHIGAHVAAQIPPQSADLLATLPQEQQGRVLMSLFGGKVTAIWQTAADGGMKMFIVPKQP